ncbi:hypothetical protein BGX27_003311 [Mortierella sp. AM989]|nr:hypothetical protein BGX27_003311 [Mortierella sp. AM989]
MDNEMQHFKDYAVTKAACLEENFISPSIEMKSIMDDLLNAMGTDRSLQKLKIFCRMQQLESTTNNREGSNHARLINVIENLKKNGGESLSESEFVSIWKQVFSHLLLTTVAWRELGLIESRSDRKKSEWVFDLNTLYHLTVKIRGIYLLEEVGPFTIPTTTDQIPAFLTTMSTLAVLKDDTREYLGKESASLKRSWSYEDSVRKKSVKCLTAPTSN